MMHPKNHEWHLLNWFIGKYYKVQEFQNKLMAMEEFDQSEYFFNKDRKTSGVCAEKMNEENNNIKNDHKSSLKKQNKKKYLTICTSNCQYDIVRRVASRFGMKEVSEQSHWNLYWTDISIGIERAKEMKRFQKINHFPGMIEICRKDLLARNLNRMLKLFPKDYNFFPKTWCLPAAYGEFAAYAKKRKFRTFIIKPESGCQGRGIYLTKNMKEIKAQERNICQVYLSKPFLIDGFKFDLRVYVLITSCDPLRIYVHNDGLVRFATCRYKEPTNQNASNVFMHLTNYSVNKHSRMYISDEEAGSKRKISHLNKRLKNNDIDIDKLWRKIDEMIVKTILSAYPVLKHTYHTCFSMHNITHACFEILGFDILIDWKMRPFLLEVNHSPSFHIDAPIDKSVKESLLMDTFELLNFNEFDKKKILEEDRQRVRDRLLQGINVKDYSINDSVDGTKSSDEAFQRQFKWEDQHMGNFRRIYPCSDDGKYQSFFSQGIASIYQNTLSSKARREEIAKIHREDTVNSSKEDGSKKLSTKLKNLKVASESPNEVKKNQTSFLKKNVNKLNIPLISSKKSNSLIEKLESSPSSSSRNVFSLFTPSPINEFEEKERRSSLAERDFIIKNNGITELIYLAMKKNGSLRAGDIKKYGFYYNLDETLELPENLQHYQKKFYPNNLTSIDPDKKRLESANKEDSNVKKFSTITNSHKII